MKPTLASPAPPTLARRSTELLQRLRALRDPQARLGQLVEHARRGKHLPEALRLEAHRVAGCQVRLWLVAEFRDGRCWFQTDSDAITLRALIGLLCELASGATPDEVAGLDVSFLEELGLLRQLAESRRATVLRVAEQLREFGRQHLGNDP